jgi:diguanylate cyclase (GGDEF)-like protein
MEEPSGAELFGMIYLDIDNFKNINDSYGHTLGDDLLITVSERLRGRIGEDVIVTRFGGDEFVLIVPDGRSLQLTHETIDKLIDTFKTPFFIDERGFFVTVSMGISVSEREGYDFDLMLKAADIAMYQAKESGKNNYMFYDPEMDRKIKRRLLIEMNLRNALDDEEFSLVYQPQILAKSGKVRGFEALIRWNNKELGQVSPLDFIPVAEETGMIEKIGKWVIQSACETIRTINSVNGTDYIMSINVSPVQISNPFFLTDLYEIIQETGIKNEWVEIEITENVFLANVEEVISIILHLTSKGILISLDDFGTGYSSLSYLNKLPIDTLKIDREFIRNLIHDKDDQKMVESIVLLAHKLGIFLVAEGVENQSQVRLLNDFSCDCIQGFYFSKPLQSDALLELIESGNLDSEIKSKY